MIIYINNIDNNDILDNNKNNGNNPVCDNIIITPIIMIIIIIIIIIMTIQRERYQPDTAQITKKSSKIEQNLLSRAIAS